MIMQCIDKDKPNKMNLLIKHLINAPPPGYVGCACRKGLGSSEVNIKRNVHAIIPFFINHIEGPIDKILSFNA